MLTSLKSEHLIGWKALNIISVNYHIPNSWLYITEPVACLENAWTDKISSRPEGCDGTIHLMFCSLHRTQDYLYHFLLDWYIFEFNQIYDAFYLSHFSIIHFKFVYTMDTKYPFLHIAFRFIIIFMTIKSSQ